MLLAILLQSSLSQQYRLLGSFQFKHPSFL
jgi:hypothetical protein